MQTEAIFKHIAARLESELAQAQHSIYIAVAWFTRRELFDVLLDKAQQGIAVHLLVSNDAINQNGQLPFEELNQGQSSALLVGNGKTDLMHNKFCVIDENIVITGSYNWSYKAENSNHENIVITTGDRVLAEQFIQQFKHIRQLYAEVVAEQEFPMAKIIKRLEILKNYVFLEDHEDIDREAKKLKSYCFKPEIKQILDALENHCFSEAMVLIDVFLKNNHQLMVWHDVEISALKLEINYLEYQLNAYATEKADLEKLLSDFQHISTVQLGDLWSELLKLRKRNIKLDYLLAEKENNKRYEEKRRQAELEKNQAQQKYRESCEQAEREREEERKRYKEFYQQAEEEEKQYQQQFNKESERVVAELTSEEKQRLKQLFRQASRICHPDRVGDEFKEIAHETFIKLKKFYDDNNLVEMEKMWAELQAGNFFQSYSQTLTEHEKLKAAIAHLKKKIIELEKEIVSIIHSEEYQQIIEIEDWNIYFEELKETLKEEITQLKTEMMEKIEKLKEE